MLLLCTAATSAAAQRCDFSNVPGAVWWGPESRMAVSRFADRTAEAGDDTYTPCDSSTQG